MRHWRVGSIAANLCPRLVLIIINYQTKLVHSPVISDAIGKIMVQKSKRRSAVEDKQ